MLGRGARRHWPRRWLPGSSEGTRRGPNCQAFDILVPSWRYSYAGGRSARHRQRQGRIFGKPCVDASRCARGDLSFWTRDRVRSCVRPPGAAFPCRGPVWRCADRVQITLGALEGRCGFPWFSRSGSSIICPCCSFAFLTPRTPDPSAGRGLCPVRPSLAPGSPRSLSSSPRRRAPSCWQVRSPPACAASWPASAPATSLRARPFAGFAARWTWRR